MNVDLVSSNQGLLRENVQLNKKLDELNTKTVDNNQLSSYDKETRIDPGFLGKTK